MELKEHIKFPKRRTCTRCGFVASQEICKACVLLEGLNTGMPKLGVGKSNKAKKIMGLEVNDGSENKAKKKPKPERVEISKRKLKRDKRKQVYQDMIKNQTSTANPFGKDNNDENLGENSESQDIEETNENQNVDEKRKNNDVEKTEEQSNCGMDCRSGCIAKSSELSKSNPDNSEMRTEKVVEIDDEEESTCGTSCGSGCQSQVSASSRLKPTVDKLFLLTETGSDDEDMPCGMSDVTLLKDEIELNEEENACGPLLDALPGISYSSDDESDSKQTEQKEKIKHKTFSKRGRRRNRSQEEEKENEEDEEDDQQEKIKFDPSVYDENEVIFNVKAFKAMMESIHPELLELSEDTDSGPEKPFVEEDLKSDDEALLSYLEERINELKEKEKRPKDRKPQTTTVQQSSSMITSDITDATKRLSLKDKKLEILKSDLSQSSNIQQSSSTVEEHKLKSSNSEQEQNKEPDVVKANPKKIKPSLLLPEMMYKTKNNLDF